MLKSLHLLLGSVAMIGVFVGPVPLYAATETAPPPAETPAAPPAEEQPQAPLLTADQLDTLLAPIALYPDPLLAQILPAATEPSDVVMAARYVAAKKDPDKIDQQPWEESVKALARYPDVLKMMDEKLDWTTQLGEAFAAQPSDVFNSVQRLRAKAKEVGNLKDSPQQVIVVEKEVIKIMPADPQVVYVPQYSPTVVYVQQPVNVVAPLITFGAGLAMGIWIHNELDWHDHHVYYHNHGWNGHYHGDYHGGNFYGGGNGNGNNITRNGGGNTINVDNSKNVNIGNGSGNRGGNSGSVWKPQNKPKPPAGAGNGNGFGNGNRPNGGNGNNFPNNGAGNNGNRPGGGGNGSGNGLGGNGNQKPATRPANPPGNGANRPAGNGSQQKPAKRPEQPTKRPAQSATRPAGGNGQFNREATKQRAANSGGNRAGAANRAAGANRGGGGGRLKQH